MVARRPPPDSDDAPTPEALAEALADHAQEIEELRARIGEIESRHAEFLSDATHAIGNPLTVIHSYLEILHTELQEGLSDEQRSFIGIAHENAIRLRRLVEDLVTYASLETGEAQLDIAPHDVSRIIESICSEMQSSAQRHGHDLTARIIGDLCPIPIDEDRLRDVLRRLIENAIRFTPDGGSISLTARAEPRVVAIDIQDTGAGLADDAVEDALLPFVQLHRKPGESREGFGIGLSLCQRLVEAMGGALELKSKEGEGTTVTVRFHASPAK